jgi:hypothetical protein
VTQRNWKRLRPTSLRHAMELCLEHAREKHRRSVDRVADLMGLGNKWALYKWMESGRMPAILIRPFEHACGIDYCTQYLAYSAHKLLIDIPAGRAVTELEIADLQASLTDAARALMSYHAGKRDAEATLAALTHAMSGLAWHRANVAQTSEPELALFEGEP